MCSSDLEALESFDKALEINPRHLEALTHKGCVSQAENKQELAIQCFTKALEVEPKHAQNWFSVGYSYEKLGRLENALNSYRKCVEIRPESALCWNNLGNLYRNTGALQEAKDAFLACIESLPEFSEAYANLSTVLLDMGESKAALTYATKALDLNPKLTNAARVLSHVFFEYYQFEAALEACLQSLNLEPDNVSIHLECGQIYDKLNQPEKAISHFLKALSGDPSLATAHIHLGIIYGRIKRYEEAKSSYTQALNLQPDLISALEGLGSVQRILGEKEAALKTFGNLLELNPKNPIALFEDASLKNRPPDFIPLEYIRYLYDLLPMGFIEQNNSMDLTNLTALAALEKVRPNLKLGKGLDLGCGSGVSASKFQHLASHWTGIDLSLNMLLQADSKKIYNALVESDILSFLREKRPGISLVLLLETLMHFGSIQPLFQALQEALDPGTILVFDAWHTTATSPFQTKNLTFAHSMNYCEDTVKSCGWKILHTEEFYLPSGPHCESKNLLIVES